MEEAVEHFEEVEEEEVVEEVVVVDRARHKIITLYFYLYQMFSYVKLNFKRGLPSSTF